MYSILDPLMWVQIRQWQYHDMKYVIKSCTPMQSWYIRGTAGYGKWYIRAQLDWSVVKWLSMKLSCRRCSTFDMVIPSTFKGISNVDLFTFSINLTKAIRLFNDSIALSDIMVETYGQITIRNTKLTWYYRLVSVHLISIYTYINSLLRHISHGHII